MNRMIWLLTAALIALTVSGCTQWNGPSQVKLKDSVTLKCVALSMSADGIRCYRAGGTVLVDWDNVSGFAAGEGIR